MKNFTFPDDPHPWRLWVILGLLALGLVFDLVIAVGMLRFLWWG